MDEKIVQTFRSNYQTHTIPKGQSGARNILKILKNNQRIGMFVDQKMNDGLKTTFFGMEAMSAPAIAKLALKYKYPILPLRTVRLKNIKHKITVCPPIKIIETGNKEKDILNIMNSINLIMEGWIREHPEQWLWIHNRWIAKH